MVSGHLTLINLLRGYRWQVAVTWLLLLLEVALLALIPLFLGRAIDSLLEVVHPSALYEIGALLTALIVVGVGRRLYDTRAYGTMRVHFASALIQRSAHKPVSQLNAQIEMGRELVDFLEEQTPLLITCVIQIVVSVIILFSFGFPLGIAGTAAVMVMGLIYLLFHTRFFKLNAGLNEISEAQVSVLEANDSDAAATLLDQRRTSEVKISDADSIMYGFVYVVMFALILANLWSASLLAGISVGAMFAILSYSWELVGASVELPEVLQQWTRLSEIQERINR